MRVVPGLAQLAEQLPVHLEAGLGPRRHHQAVRVHLEPDAVALVGVEQLERSLVERRQRARRLAEPRLRAVGAEPPQPAHVGRIERRPHHERAVRVERGAHALSDDAGRRQRVGEARRDPAGVALRRAAAGSPRVEHDHLGARAHQLVGAGDADHAGAHDGDPHGFGPRAFQAGSQSTSAASRSPAICQVAQQPLAPLGRDAAQRHAERQRGEHHAGPVDDRDGRRPQPGRRLLVVLRVAVVAHAREDLRELREPVHAPADGRHQRPPAELRRDLVAAASPPGGRGPRRSRRRASATRCWSPAERAASCPPSPRTPSCHRRGPRGRRSRRGASAARRRRRGRRSRSAAPAIAPPSRAHGCRARRHRPRRGSPSRAPAAPRRSGAACSWRSRARAPDRPVTRRRAPRAARAPTARPGLRGRPGYAAPPRDCRRRSVCGRLFHIRNSCAMGVRAP